MTTTGMSWRAVLVVLFGLVLIYVPARLLPAVVWPARIGALEVAGILTGAAGGALAAWCVSSFAFVGRGTPAPFAAPRRLVTGGPYRFVRNPMYIGVGLLFAGAALFFESRALAAYVVGFLLAGHLFVVWYEEPRLRQTFGLEYTAYAIRVGRWRPRVVTPSRS
jgi:protein-S-isoprenylcysteine O-methyltransferase Ste14